jgi:uncharacterized Zn finger protein
MAYYGWRPYVSVAERRAKAAREMRKLRKAGKNIKPIELQGSKIARTFWGAAWCRHLEQFSDFSNRLPRGRTYVRNGSVCHLGISKGQVEAIVSGSVLYNVDIRIRPLAAGKWRKLRQRCAGQIGSMLELLQGRFSDQVMQIVTDRDNGLFPKPREIELFCDCPDWATMCKHVAAVLYGIGARLDHEPELLFLLRNVDHEVLISTELDVIAASSGKGKRRRLSAGDLSGVFGIDIEAPVEPARRKEITAKKKPGAKTKKTRAARVAKKATVRRRIPAGSEPPSAETRNAFVPTGAAVRGLRKRFRMSKSQFAELLGVNPQTVSNWENAGGKLRLRQRTMTALTEAAALKTAQASKKLTGK